LFDNPILENMTMTPWYGILLGWLPWLTYLLVNVTTDPFETICSIGFGIFFWTILEYSIHRWFFHSEEQLPENPHVIAFHFLIHGVHHAFPMDRYRLVFPIVAAYVLFFLTVGPLFAATIP